jgi:Sodium:solute symporter family
LQWGIIEQCDERVKNLELWSNVAVVKFSESLSQAAARNKVLMGGHSLNGTTQHPPDLTHGALKLIGVFLVSKRIIALRHNILAVKNSQPACHGKQLLLCQSDTTSTLEKRHFMIAGFAVLAIVFYQELDLTVGGELDFESILPAAILQFVPSGILGLLLAGLLAAFMSTFASTVNAAPAYLVNDIYKRYINSVLQWLVSGLWGGYVVSNVLKWYWWRLNGMGYFWGMMAGIIGALAFPPLFGGIFTEVASDILPLYLFPLLLLFSAVVCVATSLMTKPEDKKLLKDFYKTVRPWGFWEPIYTLVKKDNPQFERNKNFKMDMANVTVGVVAQTALVALPIFIVVRESQSIIITAGVLLASAIFLKRFWFDRLDQEATGDQTNNTTSEQHEVKGYALNDK